MSRWLFDWQCHFLRFLFQCVDHILQLPSNLQIYITRVGQSQNTTAYMIISIVISIGCNKKGYWITLIKQLVWTNKLAIMMRASNKFRASTKAEFLQKLCLRHIFSFGKNWQPKTGGYWFINVVFMGVLMGTITTNFQQIGLSLINLSMINHG